MTKARIAVWCISSLVLAAGAATAQEATAVSVADADAIESVDTELSLAAAVPAALPRLRVSADGHHLVKADGSAFFWLADTAWSLDEVAPAQISRYFADRASRGFTVIQGPIVLDTDSVMGADGNATGNERLGAKHNPKSTDSARYSVCPDSTHIYPLANATVRAENPSPGAWSECYLRYLDFIVDEAARHGLYIAIPLVWGPQADWVFPKNDVAKARQLARELSSRYASRSHVVWIVAGEFHKIFRDMPWKRIGEGNPKIFTKEHVERTYAPEMALIRALAAGIVEGHGRSQLTTIHPTGGVSSSQYFHDETWLDFNMIQSGSINAPDAMDVIGDWKRAPAKPTIDAEPSYEGEDTTTVEVRYAAYQGVFQGAMGHSYGHKVVWEFAPGWESMLGAQGAVQMGYLRALIESRPQLDRVPLTSRIIDGNTGTGGEYAARRRVVATGGADKRWAFVYFPQAALARGVRLGEFSVPRLNAWWFNPRDGQRYAPNGTRVSQPFGQYSNAETVTFDPPGSGATEDWVLVLEDASADLAAPGGVTVPAAPAPGPDGASPIGDGDTDSGSPGEVPAPPAPEIPSPEPIPSEPVLHETNYSVQSYSDLTASCGSSVAVGPCAAPSAFTIQAVGGLTVARALNNQGEVAGVLDGAHSGDGAYHAGVWANGAVRDLGMVGCNATVSHCRSGGYGVSDNGWVVGESHVGADASAGSAEPQPVSWRADAVQLSLPGPVHAGVTRGVNDAGTVVGYAQIAPVIPFSANQNRAFAVVANTVHWLGGTDQVSRALAVNSQDEAAGDTVVGGQTRAFYWRDGAMTVLGHLGGGTSAAADIASGEQPLIVGSSLDANMRARGFVWAPGRMIDLGSLSAEGGSTASAVNSAGQVVGTADGRAVLWQGGRIYDLNQSLEPGVSVTLLNAVDINDHGQILAFGYIGGGFWLYFGYYLLTPSP